MKILIIFTLLNGAIWLLPKAGRAATDGLGVRGLIAVFVTGDSSRPGIGKFAAFEVLVPIAYVLLISAALSFAFRVPKYAFYITCLLCFSGICVLSSTGISNAILEGVALGLMGVSAGYIPIGKINRIAGHLVPLAAAYSCYLVAITIWNVILPLQVVGLCLILMLLYAVGLRVPVGSKIGNQVNLLGSYSLVGYVGQIGIIQLLHRAMGRLNLLDQGAGVLCLSLVAAFVFTVLAVEAVDRIRMKTSVVDKLYKLAFA